MRRKVAYAGRATPDARIGAREDLKYSSGGEESMRASLHAITSGNQMVDTNQRMSATNMRGITAIAVLSMRRVSTSAM